jgi:hypothetical protein
VDCNLLPLPEGKILYYRVWDIGDDINLSAAQAVFEQEANAQRFRLKRESRAMIINNAPLFVGLGLWQHRIGNHNLEIEAQSKIWYFGAVSITLQITIPAGLNFNQLIELTSHIEQDPMLLSIAKQKCKEVAQKIGPERLSVIEWETYETYEIYFFKSLPEIDDTMEVLKKYNVPGLILSEGKEVLSEQIKIAVTDSAYQYSKHDLAIIDWNSALVIDPHFLMDVPDVIEFALCQLLEMRYYDDLLDQKLNTLYNALEKKDSSIFSNHYEKISQEAAQKYIEISETVENVENSMKVVGDFFFAKIFRAASNKFRFKDWQESVDKKLNNLAEVSKLYAGEIHEKRSQLLEIIVIILISVELFPFIGALFKKIF